MLPIQENINKLIKQKGMNKKEFAQKLLDLNPTVSRIKEVPSTSAVYSYLNGRINIPVELISYVAEVLDVTEQELFDNSSKTRKRCFKYFLQNASKEELEYFRYFIETQMKNNLGLSYDTMIMNTHTTNEKIARFVELLPYAPSSFIDKVLAKLSEYEQLQKEEF